MYKLLTEEANAKAHKEYLYRRSVTILMASVVVFFIGLAGLFPSFILSSTKKFELIERVRMVNQGGVKDSGVDPGSWLASLNLKLQILAPELDNIRPSYSIEDVIQQKALGVRIMSFSWSYDKDKSTLSLAGTAINRDALLKFQKNLISSGKFSEVTLPVSNLAKGKDINFQMAVIISQKP